jgi:hypothetical protein
MPKKWPISRYNVLSTVKWKLVDQIPTHAIMALLEAQLCPARWDDTKCHYLMLALIG